MKYDLSFYSKKKDCWMGIHRGIETDYTLQAGQIFYLGNDKRFDFIKEDTETFDWEIIGTVYEVETDTVNVYLKPLLLGKLKGHDYFMMQKCKV